MKNQPLQNNLQLLSRRQFIKTVCGATLLMPLCACNFTGNNDISVRPITHGPKFHWFGYYDKLQFDPTDQYVLGMEVDFEHRFPLPDDVIKVGVVDLHDNDRWIELGTSAAWSWQQGCMLQWIPGSSSEIIWNDSQENRYVSHILDVTSKQKRTIPYPIYAISPTEKYALGLDFERLQDMSKGYGYVGLVDSYQQDLAPKEAGIYKIDLETGQRELIIDIQTIANSSKVDSLNFKHYFNHLLFNPTGSRFAFFHRWKATNATHIDSFGTRLLTSDLEGNDIRVITDYGHTSHFIWRDPNHILAWANHAQHGSGFFLFEDGGDNTIEMVGQEIMERDGHVTYLPADNTWILNDTYPNLFRYQQVYLYHVSTETKVSLGQFHLPTEYKNEWRVDTHPRVSRDSKKVVIDSPHGGNGRQMYLIDISKVSL